MATEISNGSQTVKLYQSVNRGKAMYQLAYYNIASLLTKADKTLRPFLALRASSDQRKPPSSPAF